MTTDIGTTRRKSMSASRRLRIFETHRGLCCLCGLRIDGTRDKWFVEHLRALELGGADDDANCGPAHWHHKSEKDAADHAAAAKAKRVKERHIGLSRTKTPMPCGKNSPFKRTMDGRVVRRAGK